MPDSVVENSVTVVEVGDGLPDVGVMLGVEVVAAGFEAGVGLPMMTDAKLDRGVDTALEAPAGFEAGVGLPIMTDAKLDRGVDTALEAPDGADAGVRFAMMTDAKLDSGVDTDGIGVTGDVTGVMIVVVTASATAKASIAVRVSSATKVCFFCKNVWSIIIL